MEYLTAAPWFHKVTPATLNRLYYARSKSKICAVIVRDLTDNTPVSAENAQILADMLLAMYAEKWEKDFDAHAEAYNPIENYNRVEQRESTRTPDLTRERSNERPPETSRGISATPAGYKRNTTDKPAETTQARTIMSEAYTDDTERKAPTESNVETYQNYKEMETPAQVTTEKEIPAVHIGENRTKKTTGTDKNQKVNNDLKEAQSIQGFNASSMQPAEQKVTTGGTTDTRTPDLTEADTEETHLDALSNPHNQAESGANVTIREYQQGEKIITGGKQNTVTYTGPNGETLTHTPTKAGSDDLSLSVDTEGQGSEIYTPTTPGHTVDALTVQTPGGGTEKETGTDKTDEKINASGNIGVTTSQQMLESEYLLNKNWIFFQQVFADIDQFLTIGTFRRSIFGRERY